MKQGYKVLAACVAILVLVVLVMPVPSPPPPSGAGGAPFVWDRDALWQRLEERFVAARSRPCEDVTAELDTALREIHVRVAALADSVSAARDVLPEEPRFDALEAAVFAAAPLAAACPERAGDFVATVAALRSVVKATSRGWDVGERPARQRLYRLLYGSRMAAEEVLLQHAPPEAPSPEAAIVHGAAPPAVTPSVERYGVRVHSGDLLLSRGGAPTSALIARGNDHPGVFSHVALLHVGEDGEASVTESLIEHGLVVTPLDDYLAEKKLRILALRLRPDLPAVQDDPLLPHRAAEAALADARSGTVAYDFAMDSGDPEERYCSEVVSLAYKGLGIDLWQGMTQISARGAAHWLASLGVRHFTIYGPSDLEYDPQLQVVAEWRDPQALFEDHVDNAVLDVLLAEAENGAELEAAPWLLPPARLAKGWSVLMHGLGREGSIPAGMPAEAALRVRSLNARHGPTRERVLERAAEHLREKGYRPPYWRLVEMAREARENAD